MTASSHEANREHHHASCKSTFAHSSNKTSLLRKYEAFRVSIYILLPLLSTSSLIYKSINAGTGGEPGNTIIGSGNGNGLERIQSQARIAMPESTSHIARLAQRRPCTETKESGHDHDQSFQDDRFSQPIAFKQKLELQILLGQHNLITNETLITRSLINSNQIEAGSQLVKLNEEKERLVPASSPKCAHSHTNKDLDQNDQKQKQQQQSLNLMETGDLSADIEDMSSHFGAKVVISIISSLILLVICASVYDRNMQLAAEQLEQQQQKQLEHQDEQQVIDGQGLIDFKLIKTRATAAAAADTTASSGTADLFSAGFVNELSSHSKLKLPAAALTCPRRSRSSSASRRADLNEMLVQASSRLLNDDEYSDDDGGQAEADTADLSCESAKTNSNTKTSTRLSINTRKNTSKLNRLQNSSSSLRLSMLRRAAVSTRHSGRADDQARGATTHEFNVSQNCVDPSNDNNHHERTRDQRQRQHQEQQKQKHELVANHYVPMIGTKAPKNGSFLVTEATDRDQEREREHDSDYEPRATSEEEAEEEEAFDGGSGATMKPILIETNVAPQLTIVKQSTSVDQSTIRARSTTSLVQQRVDRRRATAANENEPMSAPDPSSDDSLVGFANAAQISAAPGAHAHSRNFAKSRRSLLPNEPSKPLEHHSMASPYRAQSSAFLVSSKRELLSSRSRPIGITRRKTKTISTSSVMRSMRSARSMNRHFSSTFNVSRKNKNRVTKRSDINNKSCNNLVGVGATNQQRSQLIHFNRKPRTESNQLSDTTFNNNQNYNHYYNGSEKLTCLSPNASLSLRSSSSSLNSLDVSSVVSSSRGHRESATSLISSCHCATGLGKLKELGEDAEINNMSRVSHHNTTMANSNIGKSIRLIKRRSSANRQQNRRPRAPSSGPQSERAPPMSGINKNNTVKFNQPSSANNNTNCTERRQQQQKQVAFRLLIKEIFLSFSIYKNANLILGDSLGGDKKNTQTSSISNGKNQDESKNNNNDHYNEDNTGCLHGLRFFSMLWVIMIHSYSFALDWLSFEVDPRSEPFNIYKSYFGQMLSNGSFACDTFLMIAGFLLAYISIKKPNANNNGSQDCEQISGHRRRSAMPVANCNEQIVQYDEPEDEDEDGLMMISSDERESRNKEIAIEPPNFINSNNNRSVKSKRYNRALSSSLSSLDSGLSDDCSQASEPILSASRSLAHNQVNERRDSGSWENDCFSDSSSASTSTSSSLASVDSGALVSKNKNNTSSGSGWSTANSNLPAPRDTNNVSRQSMGYGGSQHQDNNNNGAKCHLRQCSDYDLASVSRSNKQKSKRQSKHHLIYQQAAHHHNSINENNNSSSTSPTSLIAGYEPLLRSYLGNDEKQSCMNKNSVKCEQQPQLVNRKMKRIILKKKPNIVYMTVAANEQQHSEQAAADCDRDQSFTFGNLLANTLHRYLRMMPLMMALIVMNTNLLAYFGSGPKYNSSTMMFDRWCRSNWWLNLIFIHNFVDTRHMCLSHSWYSAVDFQLFIVGQILLFIFYRLSRVGKNRSQARNQSQPRSNSIESLTIKYRHLILSSLCLLLITSSQLYTGLITFLYQLPMIPMMPNFSLESNISYCFKIYIKPYCRASPYFIGFLLAYYMRIKGKNIKLNRWQIMFGWSLSVATMAAVVLTTAPIFNGITPNSTFITLYGSLARPIWSCAIGWVVFASITNNGGYLSKVLAAKCFIPFSRLTYPVFLIHPIIIATFYGSRQSNYQFSHYLMFCLILGFVVITYLSAFIFSMIFELPAQSIEKAVRKYNKSRRAIGEQSNKELH